MDGGQTRNPTTHFASTASLAVVVALSIAAVLLSTNHGVGVAVGSLPLIESARLHRTSPAAPAYCWLISSLTSPKHDAPAAARIPSVVLLAATIILAALTIRRFTRDTLLAILASLLALFAPPVLRSFTILRPEPLLLLSALMSLYAADGFGRDGGAGWIMTAVMSAAVAATCGFSGIAVIPAAIVAAVTARHESRLAWGHLTFAILFAITAIAIGPRITPAFSPAMAALTIFLATFVGRPLACFLAAGCIAMTIPWIVHAQRAGHDFASPAWKHSPTMQAIAHLPKDCIFYSNAPEAVARYDRHPIHPIPPADDSAGWERMSETLTHEESFIVWFDKEPGDLDSISRQISLEKYETQDDGSLHRATTDAWLGGRRRIAFNPNTPSLPARRSAGHSEIWNQKHAKYVAEAANGGIDLLFLGDSITDDYRTVPDAWKLFEERYGRYHPANFGIDGDRTQHLLYRIEAGECDHISPKVAIILIGTNNTGEDSPQAIAAGIKACVEAARKKLPSTRILLLGLFPRGRSPTDNDKRRIILQANQLIAGLDNGETVRFLNLYDRFLQPDGTLNKDVMYDSLHPSLKGYHIWADAMQPLLDEMMRLPVLNPKTPTTRSL